MDEKIYIKVFYCDINYTHEFQEIAQSYCEEVNEMITYTLEYKDKKLYNSVVNLYIKNKDYIQKTLTNKLIGSYIKNHEYDKIVTVGDFQYILPISISLNSDIEMLTEIQFDKEKINFYGSKYLIFKFDNGKLNYNIF